MQLFFGLTSMRTPLGFDTKIHFGGDKPMICPTLCSTHGLGRSDILPIPFPDNDVINEMPVLGTRMHPRCFLSSGQAKDCVGDEEIMR